MAQSTKCLILLAVIALFFITEIIPLAVTAMAGSIACGLLGFIPAKQVFSGLSNSTVVLFAGMFVVGAAMFYTGLCSTPAWPRKSVKPSSDLPVPVKTV